MGPTVAERVKAIVRSELAMHEDAVVDVARLDEDLGADSHDRLSLTLALENEFDLEIPDRDGRALETVGDLIAYIAARRTASI